MFVGHQEEMCCDYWSPVVTCVCWSPGEGECV